MFVVLKEIYSSPTQITIAEVDLGAYDALLSIKEEVLPCYQMS